MVCAGEISSKLLLERSTARMVFFAADHFAMPRYYFHLSDGKQVLNNHKGIDLSGNAAAREDALALAPDLKTGAVMPGWDWSGWFVTIVDAACDQRGKERVRV